MEDIYFIPGTMCTRLLWENVYKQMEEYISPIDLTIENHQSFEQIAQSILKKLPAEKISIVGFSLGGYIASYLASFYPERIEKVMVVANSPCSLNDNELSQRAELVRSVEKFGYKGMTRQMANRYLDSSDTNMVNSERRERNIDTIITMDRALGQETFLSQMINTTHREDLLKLLSNTQVPITFYSNEKDRMVNCSWLKQAVNNNDKHTLHIGEGSGHMIPIEQYLELAHYIKEWLR